MVRERKNNTESLSWMPALNNDERAGIEILLVPKCYGNRDETKNVCMGQSDLTTLSYLPTYPV